MLATDPSRENTLLVSYTGFSEIAKDSNLSCRREALRYRFSRPATDLNLKIASIEWRCLWLDSSSSCPDILRCKIGVRKS